MFFPMYAISTPSLVYHIARNHKTLCGLFVVGVKPEADTILGPLHLVAEKPSDRILCKTCERVVSEKSSESE